ncbi:class 1 fructose-bisphosphatase [Halocatena halophila]|uniref:class 1 fructose-bisphosphatase n=1 Tax=Halocatena halophila TaxID=2814576 RepID=UPI002ED13F16
MTLSPIFEVVAETASEIRSSLAGRRTYEDGVNPSGETQLEADVYADRLLEERLCSLSSVGKYASEERDAAVGDGEGYTVAVDPLDGSSNVKSNNAMGTIVGVYEESLPTTGRSLVGAGYVLYGPLTTMVVADDGVTEYVIEDGEPTAVREDLSIPADPVVYGFGGRKPDWPAPFASYAETVATELKLRYGGAMIGDVNQVLTYGGIFAYPALDTHPDGKLRLLFEGAPIAHIINAAGGSSSDGSQSLLDVEITDLHQRVPVHVGNTSYIDRLEETLAE